MIPSINHFFRVNGSLFHSRVTLVCIWISPLSLTFTSHSNPTSSLSPQGFDEYMNLVLEDAEEVNKKKGTKKTVGRILLKGDNITMMVNLSK